MERLPDFDLEEDIDDDMDDDDDDYDEEPEDLYNNTESVRIPGLRPQQQQMNRSMANDFVLEENLAETTDFFKEMFPDNPMLPRRARSNQTFILEEVEFAKMYRRTMGCYPLRMDLPNLLKDVHLTEINFSRHELLTDVIIVDIFSQQGSVLDQLKKVNLSACVHLTDISMIVIAQFISENPSLTSLVLDGCHGITEKGLLALSDCTSKPVTVSAKATGVSFIPKSLSRHQFTLTNCPLLQVKSLADDKAPEILEVGSVVISPLTACPPEHSLLKYLTNGSLVPTSKHFNWCQSWKQDSVNFTVVEIPCDHPCASTLLPKDPVQVLLPFSSEADTKLVAESLAETMMEFIKKDVYTGDTRHASPLSASSGLWSPSFIMGQNCDLSQATVECVFPFPDRVPIPQIMMAEDFSRFHSVFELEVIKAGSTGDTVTVDIGIVNDTSRPDKKFTKKRVKSAAGDRLQIVLELMNDGNEWSYNSCGHFTFFHNKFSLGTEYSEHPSSCCPGFSIQTPGAVVRYASGRDPPNQSSRNRTKDDLFISSHQINKGVIVDEDSGIITYNCNDLENVMTFRGHLPISASHDEFEFTIVKEGKRRCISIGLMPEVGRTSRQPGWDPDSIGYHADDGRLFCREDVEVIEAVSDLEAECHTGDVMKLRMTFPPGEERVKPNNTYVITFFKNSEKVKTVKWRYVPPDDNVSPPPSRLVPVIGMHSEGEQVKLDNFFPTFNNAQLLEEFGVREKSPNFLIKRSVWGIIDGRVLSLKCSQNPQKRSTAHYLSYNSLTRSHNYYEIKIMDAPNEVSWPPAVGIGVSHSNIDLEQMVGWQFGSIGVHFDNSKLYAEATSGGPVILEAVKPGDIIGFGFETEGVEFDSVSQVPKCNQKLEFYFIQNGVKKHSHKHWYVGGGLHATITTSDCDFTAELLNHFDPNVDGRLSKDKSENTVFGGGVNFLAVGMGKSQTQDDLDTVVKSNLDDIKSHLTEQAYPHLEQSNFMEAPADGSFMMHRQRGLLQKAVMSLKSFINQFSQRFSVINLDLSSSHDQNVLVQRVVANQKAAFEWRYYLYEFLPNYKSALGKLEEAKRQKVITLPEFVAMCQENEIESGLFGHYTGACCRLLKLAHDWGKIIYLEKCKPPLVVTDVDCFLDMVHCICSAPSDTAGEEVRCVSDETRVWRDRSLLKLAMQKLQDISRAKVLALLQYMTSCGLLLQLATVRSSPGDTKYFLLAPSSLAGPPTDTAKYLSTMPNQYRVIETYKFHPGMSTQSFGGWAAFVGRFCKPSVMWSEGLVWHCGAVEMVLTKTSSAEVLLQATSFLPPSGDDEDDLNKKYSQAVRRNVWAQLGLFSDVFQYQLLMAGILYTVSHDSNPLIERFSICSKHTWQRPHDIPESTTCVSVCTMCNNCGANGWSCDFNAITGPEYRICLCPATDVCCWNCGICKHCAKELWAIKSWLRPGYFENNKHAVVTPTLDLVTFDSFEVTALEDKLEDIYLNSGSSERLLKIFPGTPLLYKDSLLLADQKFDRLSDTIPSGDLYVHEGDRLKISIKNAEESATERQLDDAYNFCICQNVSFLQSYGQLEFHPSKQGLFGHRESNRRGVVISEVSVQENGFYEIEVIETGSGELRFGMTQYCQRKQRFADDKFKKLSTILQFSKGEAGLNTLGENSPVEAKLNNGCVLGCGLRKSPSGNQCVYFTMDGKELCEKEVESGDLYAAVLVNSSDQMVRLHPADVWKAPPQPDGTDEEDENFLVKDGLKIFPKKHLEFPKNFLSEIRTAKALPTKKGKGGYNQEDFTAPITITNTQAKTVLFKVRVTNPSRYTVQPNKGFLKMDATETATVKLRASAEEMIENDKLQIQWVAVEKYNFDLEKFDSLFKQYSDRLSDTRMTIGWKETSHDPNFTELRQTEGIYHLPDVRTRLPPQEESYYLEIEKNGRVVSRKYIPRDIYFIGPTSVRSRSSVYKHLAISCPKAAMDPVTVFTKGMQVKVKLPQSQLEVVKNQPWCWVDINSCFANVLVERLEAGSVCVSMPLMNKNKVAYNSYFSVNLTDIKPVKTHYPLHSKKESLSFNFEDKDSPRTISAEMTIDDVTLTLSYVYPNFVTTPRIIHKLMSSDGHSSVIDAMGVFNRSKQLGGDEMELPVGKSCRDMPHLTSVFDTELSRSCHVLREWEQMSHPGGQVHLGVFLPGTSLSTSTLLYPSLSELFNMDALAWHALCKSLEKALTPNYEKITHPAHFVDSVGQMNSEIKECIAGFWSNLWMCWTYGELATRKLRVPVFDHLVTMENGIKLDRYKVEACLSQMMGIYNGVCQISAWVHGGYSSLPHSPLPTPPDKDTDSSTGPLLINNGCCKSHNPQYTQPTSSVLDVSRYEPYGEMVTILNLSIEGVEEIPDDLVTKLPNLEHISFSETDSVRKLPASMSPFQSLKTFSLSGQTKLESLPADIGDCPSLKKLHVTLSPIKELPESLTRSLALEYLCVSSCLIRHLPKGFSRLKSLKHLNLSENPILELPEDFGELSSLVELKLSGVPWITPNHSQRNYLFPSSSTNVDTDQRRQISLNSDVLTKPVYTELIQEVVGDLSEVNSTALSEINAKLHHTVPRLALTQDESSDADNTLECIFKLKNLQVLELDYQALYVVPQSVAQLVNLRSLSLNHCMNLYSLPGALGTLPNIKTLSLKNCPALRTPPNEIVSRGTDSVLAYLKWLNGGFVENWRTKLMLVGLGGAGKTSLLRALMSSQHRTKPLSGEEITDGIDIKTWPVKYSSGDTEKTITFSAWDFAGQTVYYNTHQFFLSNRAVYLLLWTTRLGYEHSGLEFWLSSIKCHAPNAPIFVIGTHCDQIAKAELPESELKRHYPQICGFHYISSITGKGIGELQDAILEATAQESYMGERVSKVYLHLEEKIVQKREETSVLDWDQVKQFGLDAGIFEEKDLREAVQFLHYLGTVQYFDNDFLRDHIVINPQWIVDVMACVVSVKDSCIKDGRFNHEDINNVWKDQPEDLHEWLLRLTEEFDLTFPLSQEPVNLVPCLLPQNEPDYKWKEPNKNLGEKETLMKYRFEYLPAGLFNRMQVRLFQFSDTEMIWKRGSLLLKKGHSALILQPNDKELIVRVKGLRPENILFLVHEVLESLIAESFQGVDYDYLVPCLDCLSKEECEKPCMFEGSLIRDALIWNAPFLQCRKYFHAISMPMLQASMPPDNSKEFDIHLQHSVRNLADLRSDLTTDLFFYFCPEDIPAAGDNDRVHPRAIYNDLVQEGYKCWYHEDLNQVSIQDTFMALQDSKLLIVLMSNEFEKDERCRKLFLYAKDELQKPYQVLAVGTGLEWQETHMGWRMGGSSEVFVNMRQKSRYSSKLPELKERITMKLSKYNTVTEHPRCFISYAWSNSHDAILKGSRSKEGSLGWGDPREIKNFLEEKGVTCWIDTEQAGKVGLFQDISAGIKNADIMVACVSEEYSLSDNCMMELRFACGTLKKPVIMAVVGTTHKWMSSEIGTLRALRDCELVYFQEESQVAYPKLLSLVQEAMARIDCEKVDSEATDGDKKKDKKRTAKPDKAALDQSTSRVDDEWKNIFLHEEIELAQRQFLRHTAAISETTASRLYPRLFVIDFSQNHKEITSQGSRPKSALQRRESDTSVSDNPKRPSIQRRDTLQKSSQSQMAAVELSEEWVDESLCVHILCEHEQGWHFVEEESINLPDGMKHGEKEALVEMAAPYLGRLYLMLVSSGIHLNYLSSPVSQGFKDFVMERMNKGSADFSKSYEELRKHVTTWDTDLSYGKLDRCHLPTGQIRWLCEEHQKGNRITVLSSNTSANISRQPLVSEEDVLMKTFMEKHAHIADKWKTKKETEKFSNTPASSAGSKSRSSPMPGSISRRSSRIARTGQTLESLKKLKVAGETVKAASNWPNQPTSRACAIL